MAQQNKKRKTAVIILLIILAVVIIGTICGVVLPDYLMKPYAFGYSENGDGTYSVTIFDDPFSKRTSADVITIPSEYEGKRITRIGSNSSSIKTEINEIIVPEGIESIAKNAFPASKLKKLTLPSSIKELSGDFAYHSIELNFQSNDYFRFEDNCIVEIQTHKAIFGLDGCTIPNDVTTIGEFAFIGAKITNSSIPSNVTTLEANAFCGAKFNNFDKLVLSSNIKSIGGGAFSSAEGFNKTIQIATTGSINCNAFSYCEFNTLILDVVPNITGEYTKFQFHKANITNYYEREDMPHDSKLKETESDLEGYKKFRY